jgi:hypothetical protein
VARLAIRPSHIGKPSNGYWQIEGAIMSRVFLPTRYVILIRRKAERNFNGTPGKKVEAIYFFARRFFATVVDLSIRKSVSRYFGATFIPFNLLTTSDDAAVQ